MAQDYTQYACANPTCRLHEIRMLADTEAHYIELPSDDGGRVRVHRYQYLTPDMQRYFLCQECHDAVQGVAHST